MTNHLSCSLFKHWTEQRQVHNKYFTSFVQDFLVPDIGLTKVPIDGQPKSIVKDLEDMARTYIKVNLL